VSSNIQRSIEHFDVLSWILCRTIIWLHYCVILIVIIGKIVIFNVVYLFSTLMLLVGQQERQPSLKKPASEIQNFTFGRFSLSWSNAGKVGQLKKSGQSL